MTAEIIKKKKGGKEPPDPEILKIFSENLKGCIPTNDWLASKTGLSSQAIADYVNGISLPRADFLLKISKAVDKSIEWLLTGEEKTHPSCYVECNPEIKPLCEKLKNVINSETKYAKVLKENIEAFDLAVKEGLEASGNRRKSDKLISSLTTRIEHLEKMFDLKLNTDTD